MLDKTFRTAVPARRMMDRLVVRPARFRTLPALLVAAVLVTQSISLLDSPRRWNLTAVAVVASTIPLLIVKGTVNSVKSV